MLFSKDLTNLIVLDVKRFEDTEFLTKHAQHLAELYSNNAFEFIYLLNSSEGSRNYPIVGNTFDLGSKGQNWALREKQVKAMLQELSPLKQIYWMNTNEVQGNESMGEK